MTTEGVTRRAFVQTTASFGAATGLMKLGLTSWVSAQENPYPQSGGILSYNMVGDPKDFDLYGQTAGVGLQTLAPCYNGLVQYDPLDPASIIGDLAKSWDVSTDGTVYTFSLHEGVLFHDKSPLTSADVKFSFDVMRDPPAGYVSARKPFLAQIASIETPDDLTVVFKLTGPSPVFLQTIAPGWYAIMPKHILEQGPMTDKVVGTGPFMMSTYSRGNSYELARNPDYFVPDRPYIETLRGYVIPDQGTTLSYFKSGQLNMFESVQQSIAHEIERDMVGVATVQALPNLNVLSVYFNSQKEPWNDVRVRKAAALSIDRMAAVRVNFGDDALLGGLAPPFGKWALSEDELHAIPGFSPTPMDGAIDEAKALLAEAGFPNGFESRMVVRRDDRFTAWGVFMQDQFRKVGINLRLDPQESATFEDTLRTRNYDVLGQNVNNALDDPTAIFGNLIKTGAPANFAEVSDPTLDQLVDAVAIEPDPAERKRVANELERSILNQYYVLPVCFPYLFVATRNEIHDYRKHYQTDNNRKRQDIWIRPA